MRSVHVVIAVMALSGCSPVIFDQRSNGMTLERDVDDIFTIALPRPSGDPGAVRLMPEVLGRAVKVLERSDPHDPSETRFKFIAFQSGEAEIRIWRVGSDGRHLAEEYSVKVRVRLADW